MIIAHVVTLPADDTGYTLRTLLENAGLVFTEGRPPRFATLKINMIGNAVDEAFIVPAAGAYTPSSGNIPPHYGWNFSTQGTLFEMQLNVNAISIDEIILGGAQNQTFDVFAYSV